MVFTREHDLEVATVGSCWRRSPVSGLKWQRRPDSFSTASTTISYYKYES